MWSSKAALASADLRPKDKDLKEFLKEGWMELRGCCGCITLAVIAFFALAGGYYLQTEREAAESKRLNEAALPSKEVAQRLAGGTCESNFRYWRVISVIPNNHDKEKWVLAGNDNTRERVLMPTGMEIKVGDVIKVNYRFLSLTAQEQYTTKVCDRIEVTKVSPPPN